MTQITRSIIVHAPPEQVWKHIGDFHALADWHPAVAKSEQETKADGSEIRHLTLGDGGTIIEKFLGSDSMSYAYAILQSPLPVADYVSIISAIASGANTAIVWSSTFSALNDQAPAIISGVYQAGLDALGEKFGN